MKHTASIALVATVFAAALSSAALAGECGTPTKGEAPRASDALFVLRAAVQNSECALRVCDVSDSNTVTAADALLILRGAVGQDVDLNCPVG